MYDSNHSFKFTVLESRARERQTDGRVGRRIGWIAQCPPKPPKPLPAPRLTTFLTTLAKGRDRCTLMFLFYFQKHLLGGCTIDRATDRNGRSVSFCSRRSDTNLMLPADEAEQSLCNGRASVRPSVCLSRRPTAATAALLRAGDIDRQLRMPCCSLQAPALTTDITVRSLTCHTAHAII